MILPINPSLLWLKGMLLSAKVFPELCFFTRSAPSIRFLWLLLSPTLVAWNEIHLFSYNSGVQKAGVFFSLGWDQDVGRLCSLLRLQEDFSLVCSSFWWLLAFLGWWPLWSLCPKSRGLFVCVFGLEISSCLPFKRIHVIAFRIHLDNQGYILSISKFLT